MIHAKVLPEPSRIWNVERDFRVFDDHCLGSLAVMCQIKRKAISVVLDAPNECVDGGSGCQYNKIEGQIEQRQRSYVAQRTESPTGLETTDRSGAQQMGQPQSEQYQARLQRDDLPHIAGNIVPHLVSHDDQQLALICLTDHRVKYNNPFGCKDTSDLRVGKR